MVYPLSRHILGWLFKRWVKEIKGRENIPLRGRFIVCPNHTSYFDDVIVPLIISPVTNKKVHNYVNRNYFRIPVLGRLLLSWGGSIPVEVGNAADKKKVNEKAFTLAQYHLKEKGIVGIYPEGHRSKDNELQKARFGAARLALTARVPVLPVGIQGAHEVLPKGRLFPRFRKKVVVSIGKPLHFEKYYGKKDDTKTLEAATREIMQAIASLIGKRYLY
ncbi:1-acyl-sn-glycerol-3-phosphate acyltransferase [Candidatus Woesearchaeota archaeon]|nr:1-acyl-sn-glycerol-3-phosphate acyltransferase [Candidatus Woesearchaeota archaeon]